MTVPLEHAPILSPSRTARPERAAPPAPEPPPPRRLSPWWMLLGVATLGGSITIASLSLNPVSPSPGGPVAPPRGDRRAVAVAYVDVEGGVRPLYPAVPGRVIEAPVPEGKEVESGAVLLRIDDALAQARLEEAKFEYEGHKEKLAAAKKLVAQHQMKIDGQKAAVDASRKKLEASKSQASKAERLKGLGGTHEDVASANNMVEADRALVRVEEVKLKSIEALDPDSAVRMATLEVDGKKKQVEKAQLGVRECTIFAPCKGVILRRLVNVGEVLGQTPNRPAVEFCPSGDRIVRAEVEQEFAGKLFVGQKAEITDDMTGSGEWHGEVMRISDWFTQRRAVLLEPMQYNDIRTLEVIIRLKPDAKSPLRINQRVRVKLAGEK